MSNYNERNQVGQLLKKITEQGNWFRNNPSYNYEMTEILKQETEDFTIKVVQGKNLSRLSFFDKKNEELFHIVQRDSISNPSFDIVDNENNILDYETQSKILKDTKNSINNFEIFFQKKIDDKKEQREQEHKDKLNNIYQYFGLRQLDNNPPQVLYSAKTYKYGVEYLIKYLFKASPSHLYEKNKNGDLVYSFKTSMGEVEVNFGNTNFHSSEKRLKINFLNDKKETVFTINGFRDKMFNEEIFDMNILTKDTIIKGYEESVVLATIPTEKIIKEMIEIINEDIKSFESGVKKEKEDLLKKVSQLEQPEVNEKIQEPVKKDINSVENKTDLKEYEPEKSHKSIILSMREKLFSSNKKTNKNNLD